MGSPAMTATDSGVASPGDTVAIGIAIRRARREAGLTQEQLAELAETSVRTLRDIEKGSGGTSIAAVIASANALGLRVAAR